MRFLLLVCKKDAIIFIKFITRVHFFLIKYNYLNSFSVHNYNITEQKELKKKLNIINILRKQLVIEPKIRRRLILPTRNPRGGIRPTPSNNKETCVPGMETRLIYAYAMPTVLDKQKFLNKIKMSIFSTSLIKLCNLQNLS